VRKLSIVHFLKLLRKLVLDTVSAISGRKRKSLSVKELLINDTIVCNDKVIAESFNDFFTNI
jgi:hypothetical protein